MDGAHANFRKESLKTYSKIDFTGVLCLVDSNNNRQFDRLYAYADEARTDRGRWSFYHTDEQHSLCARSVDNRKLFIIAGLQVVTAEKLELLAIPSDIGFTSGTPIGDLIDAVNAESCIPVVPWGFGKWTGQRAKTVRKLLASGRFFFLGDNGGRPKCLPDPHLFKIASEKAIPILAGSDPLPFRSETNRSGGFGVSIQGSISPLTPAKDLARILANPGVAYRAYGRLESSHRFVKNQLGMQISKVFDLLKRRFLGTGGQG